MDDDLGMALTFSFHWRKTKESDLYWAHVSLRFKTILREKEKERERNEIQKLQARYKVQ